MHNRWRLFVKSAGNRGTGDGRVTSPGNGYNVLAVGNADLNGTAARADDTMRPSSSFVDPTSTIGDREKPEVTAPGSNIRMLSNGFPWSGQIDTGTSMAAPMVAGSAARLIQRKPFLGVWPEQLRAILMASATNNIEGPTRLSDVDGAGMMNVNSAVRILDDNRHGGQYVGCSSFGSSQVVSSTSSAGISGCAPRSRGPLTRPRLTTRTGPAPTWISRCGVRAGRSGRPAGTTRVRSWTSARRCPARTRSA